MTIEIIGLFHRIERVSEFELDGPEAQQRIRSDQPCGCQCGVGVMKLAAQWAWKTFSILTPNGSSVSASAGRHVRMGEAERKLPMAGTSRGPRQSQSSAAKRDQKEGKP